MATVLAEVKSARMSGLQAAEFRLFEVTFGDGSSETLHGKWFHGGYLQNVLVPGARVALFGKIEFDNYGGRLQVMHPEFELLPADDEDGESALHTGRIVPIYEAASKITTRIFRSLLYRANE
jgi:ATP-dependent DNA helicase RecG